MSAIDTLPAALAPARRVTRPLGRNAALLMCLLLALPLALPLSGCKRNDPPPVSAASGQPPPTVTVAPARPARVPVTVELPGRVNPLRVAQVRARAEANVRAQALQAGRFQKLIASNAVSAQEYDNAIASQGQAAADVASGRASVRSARISLGYTDVVTPITGRVGIPAVTEGAFVQAGQATCSSRSAS